MVRFKLGSIPVEVHASHLIISALFGLSFIRTASGLEGWPPAGLENLGQLGVALSGLLVVMGWITIVFVSVLTHEMGHALAARAYGYSSVVRLVWLGGHTTPEVRGPLPWNRDVGITAAGPGASLLLTLLAGGAWWLLRDQPPSGLSHFVDHLLLANVLWTALNLLPVMPLDGGRLALQFGRKLLGRRGVIASQVLAFLVCAAVVVLGWNAGQPFVVMIFAMFGFQTVRLMMAILRGESPIDGAEPPLEPELEEANAHLRAGRLEEAQRAAGAALDQAKSQRVASRAHLILGWTLLKEGNGRRALDHFSRVQGLRVPAHALAASFSLIGDEARALPLWEIAVRETHDPTVLHEWAGALIRAGRVEVLSQIPGIRMDLAYGCAVSTLFLRGAYSEAARIAEEGLERAPTSALAYEAACAHTRAGHFDGAMAALQRAEALGYRDWDYAATDDDLARLHAVPAFSAWLAAGRERTTAPVELPKPALEDANAGVEAVAQ